MECPYNIPLKAKYGKLSDSWFVENAKGIVLFFDLTEQRADYIVQAINSHEKLVDVCRNALTSLAITKLPRRLDDIVATNDDIIKIVISSFEQALKEAEKK